ncbi:MAG: acyl--CoA ligase [Lachnospiraceae bacterium]|nr:acyl--CoA ligase [Lachnospiraceae bacterium]
MHSIVEAIATYAAKQPEKLCVADGKNTFTYLQYWEHIAGFARQLAECGVKPGDCVVVRNSQNAAFLTAGLALQLLGAVFVPIEKNVADRRIREICEEVEAVWYIATKEPDFAISYLDMGNVLTHAMPVSMEHVVFPKGTDLAEILFTTGTTGKSKGIEILHKNVIAVAENVIDGVEMKPDNVELIPVPLSHSHGLRRYYANMLNGSSVVLADGVIFVKQIFERMRTYGVTSMDLVPAALAALLKLGGDELGQFAGQIDYIQLGSAPIPEADRERLRLLFPDSRLYNFYGTTESGCSCIFDFNKYGDKKNCIGRPTCHAVFAFLDEDGKEVSATKNQPGFLACKGEMNMAGYYRSPSQNEAVFSGDFIVTQDMAYIGDDGMIYLLGRKGDVIQSGGNKISPQEVEEAALEMEGIADCACIPVESPLLGQEPKLFYVAAKGISLQEEELYEFLKRKLETYKVPKKIERIDQIPRTYNGKIQRNLLMERER